MTAPLSRSERLTSDAVPVGGTRVAVDTAPGSGEPVVAHLQMLSEHIRARPAGTEQAMAARRYVERAIRQAGGTPDTQPFSMVVRQYRHCTLATDAGRMIPCLPALGSASTPGVLRAIPRPWRGGAADPQRPGLEDGLLLCPVGPDPASAYTRLAAERNVAGVILYHPDVPDLYSEVLPRRADELPCVTVCRADAEWLAREQIPVRLDVAGASLKVLCSNILVEIGSVGHPLLVLAHYDTRPASPGALCNASGTAVLLDLLGRLRGWVGPRILLGFLDGEELGAAGSRHCRDVLHAMGTLKYLRGVIYVSEIGRESLSVTTPERDPTSPRSGATGQSRLVRVAKQRVLDERIAVSEDTEERDPRIPAGIWSCPTIGLQGPAMPVRHTSADRPDCVHPAHLAATAAALDRLVRTL